MNLIPDPVAVLLPDGEIVDLNEPCSRLAGKKKENLVGGHFSLIPPLATLAPKISDVLTSGMEDFELLTAGDKHFEVFIRPFETARKTLFVRVLLKDITNFVNLERELLKRNKELMMFNTLSGAFMSSGSMDRVMENLLKKVLLITDFGVGILLVKEDESLRLKAAVGISLELQRAIGEGLLDHYCAEAVGRGEPLDIVDSSRLMQVEPLIKDGIVFMVAVPLAFEKDIIGFLLLATRRERERHFDFDFASLLSLLGNHISLIVDKIRLFEETKRLSVTDGLTGLFNTRYLYSQLDNEIARINRYGGSCSVLLFDIDNFKALNDTYGHQAGDDVLHDIALILKRVSRETDVVVRYGGEEFIIILPNTYEKDARYLSERIRREVEKSIFLQEGLGGTSVTVSGGIASYPLNASDAKSLLNAADKALYSAKASGKNIVLCYKGVLRGKDIH